MREVRIESFVVSGPGVRTNNALEGGGSGQIPALWAQFHASRPAAAGATYGVYSGYASDASGDFTVTAGARTAGGASGVTIQAGAYLAFPADGEMPAAIIDAWKDVWAYFSTDRWHERSYETDFEEYSGPASATIYIGVNARS